MSQQVPSDALVDTYRALLSARLASKPTQPTKTRGPAGILGKGTPGRRLKRACPDGVPLKVFARQLDKSAEKHPRKLDASAWLASKRSK